MDRIADPLALLQGLFTHAPVSFQVYTPDGHSLLVNDAFRELFGSEPPPGYCIFDDEIARAQGLDALIRRAFEGETIRTPEFWYDPRELQHVQVADGRRVAIEMTLFPVRDHQGVVRHVAISHKDVTARAKLREREQELAATLDSIGDAVIATDTSGKITRLNEVAVRLTGWPRDEAVGRPLDEVFRIVNAETRATVESPVTVVLREGRVVGLANHTVLLSRDGREYAIADSGAPILDATGVLLGVVMVFRDVTAEYAADRRLQIALREGRIIYYESNFDTGEIKLSDNALALLGLTEDQRPTRSDQMMAMLHPEDYDRLIAERARLHAGDHASRQLEMRYLRRDNREPLWVERRGHLVQTEGGYRIGSGILLDITERKRADELRARSSELELQNRRIQEANRLKSEFLANMSHELRTPLNAIIGFAEVLHDGQVDPTSPQHKEFLGDILASGRHLAQLINDILDLAKVEAGKLEFRAEPVLLPKLIGEVVAVLRTGAAAKRLRIELDLDKTIEQVALDPARLKQVLYNYLSNAIKFTPEGGRVIVRTRPEDDERFRIEVEDTGVGVPPEQLGLLFVEFQQLESGVAKRHQGTGLGLALTRRLAEAQGGSVGAKSTPGVGSVFHAILPRRAAGVEPRRPRRTFGVPMPRGKILVVEDDPKDQGVLIEVLTTAGYAVEVVATGADALARAQEETFDAVTLDLLLPDMNGLELLSGLRASGRHAATPIVVVTVVGDARAVAGFAVHDVLDKPLDSAALLASLERAGVRPAPTTTVLVVDDDPAALRLMEATLAPLGYRVTCRGDGAAGLEAASLKPPSAIILDLMMPGMDGFEFLERLRDDPRHAEIPVVIWSLKELTRDEELRLADSAQAVVAKQGGPPAVARMLAALAPARRTS